MKTLAADGLSTLRRLTISREFNWFKDGGREDCIDSLLIILSRQTQLEFLNMFGGKTSKQGCYVVSKDRQQKRIKGEIVKPDDKMSYVLSEEN